MSDSQSQDVRIVAVKTARGRLQPLEEIDLVSDSDSDETYFEGAEDRGPAIVEEDYHHHDGLHPHLELDVLDMELEAVEQRHPHLELEVLDMELEAMECDEEVEGGQNFWENLLTDGEESEDVQDLDSDSDETYFEDAEDRGPAIVEEDYHPHGLGHQHDLELEVNPEAHEELHRQDDLVLEVDLDALLDSHEYDEEVEGGQNFWENLLTDGEDSEDDDGYESASQADTE